MAENKISYLARNYNDYQEEIKDITRKYYPDVFYSLNDASIGQWLIDILSDMGDNLSYHIDRVYQETNIDSAYQASSLRNIARTNNFRIPGAKAAIVEIELTCSIPVNTQGNQGNDGRLSTADENYCPYIRMGTQFSTGSETFELIEDVDFKNQFNSEGYSNRTIVKRTNSNGQITHYEYTKTGLAVAAVRRIYSHVISNMDIEPFMSVVINDSNILNIESIIFKEGSNLSSNPSFAEFYVDKESYKDITGNPVQRYFEVDNLIDQYRFGYEVDDDDLKTVQEVTGRDYGSDELNDNIHYRYFYNPKWVAETRIGVDENGNEIVDEDGNPVYIPYKQVVKGEWKRLKNKFVTEFLDNNNLKITFGAGLRNKYGEIPETKSEFTRYMMSRMEANDYMGALPESGATMYVLYRVGGGDMTNIAKDTLTNIISLSCSIDGNCEDPQDSQKKSDVRNSIIVTNTSVSYGGKDAPNGDEIRYMLKYHNGEQNRCVTLKDYYSRIGKIDPKYGIPYRYNVYEENNKICVYTLGLDADGYLTNVLNEYVAQNIQTYLSKFKMVTDFIEIKSGKIINIGFNIVVYVDKAYEKAEVAKRIIDLTADYMDIRRHRMGEDIYLGDLTKEISKLDGVLQFVKISCFNKVGEEAGYSNDPILQELTVDGDCVDNNDDDYADGDKIDLNSSEYILFCQPNSMYEVKYKNKDIRVVVKTR